MNSFIILVIGLLLMALGYFVYGRFIAQKILALDPDFNTPSHEFNDGVDFVPTNKYVTLGSSFYLCGGCCTYCRASDCGDLGLVAGLFMGRFRYHFLCRCARYVRCLGQCA